MPGNEDIVAPPANAASSRTPPPDGSDADTLAFLAMSQHDTRFVPTRPVNMDLPQPGRPTDVTVPSSVGPTTVSAHSRQFTDASEAKTIHAIRHIPGDGGIRRTYIQRICTFYACYRFVATKLRPSAAKSSSRHWSNWSLAADWGTSLAKPRHSN